MYYVVQENLFREYNYKNLLETLERFGFDHEIVSLTDGRLNVTTEREDVFCFGAILMSKLAAKMGWKYGSMLDSNHDFDMYAKGFGMENMLNGDAKIFGFDDSVPINNYRFFVKPVKDSKAFTGKVFTHKSWYEFVKNYFVMMARYKDEAKFTGRPMTLDMPEDVKLIASYEKNIQQEVRCWVVGGKVITSSLYKRGIDVIYVNYDDESFYIDFAQRMVDKHQVAEAFVLDICLVDNELKIVEVNNINSAGFYDCNMNLLLDSIDTHFGTLYDN